MKLGGLVSFEARAAEIDKAGGSLLVMEADITGLATST